MENITMENLCFDMKDLYHRILIGLLSLKFSKNYFERNEEVRKIVTSFLEPKNIKPGIGKKELLKELENEGIVLGVNLSFDEINEFTKQFKE